MKQLLLSSLLFISVISFGQVPNYTVNNEQKISATSGGLLGPLDNSDKFGSDLAHIGDLNGDGFPDMVVGVPGDDDGGLSRGAVYILFLNADGTILSEQKISQNNGGFGGILSDGCLFGYSVSSVGDLNGDGVKDIAVGAPRDSDGGSAGAVWILFLNSDGTVLSEQKISSSFGGFGGIIENNDDFGCSISNIGDLNGDGNTDIAIGAFADDDGGINKGAIYILFLNSDGTVQSEQKISENFGGFTGSLSVEGYFGVAIAPLGDLNGDSKIDIVVGNFRDNDGGTDRGAVWILFLENDGTVLNHQKISNLSGGFTAPFSDIDEFGSAVENLGDLTGDGLHEIAVGVPRSDDGGTDRGAFWILSLNSSGIVQYEIIKISSTQGNFNGSLADDDRFGYKLANLGDLNGDGAIDIGVGSYLNDDGGIDRGAAWIVFLECSFINNLFLTDTLSTCGATTTLDAGTDPSWDSYLWNTTETTQDISVSNSGIYTIAVTDTAGCVGYDTTLVSIIDPTITASDTVICSGDSVSLSVSGNYTSMSNYSDSILIDQFTMTVNSAYTHTTPLFDNNKTYRIYSSGRYGYADGWSHCDAAWNYRFNSAGDPSMAWLWNGVNNYIRPDNDNPNPNFSAGSDKTYYWTIQGDNTSHIISWVDGGGYGDNSGSLNFEIYEMTQAASNNNSILWSTGDTTSSITVQPTQTTTYSVTVDDGISSCTDDVTITVNDPQVNLGPDQSVCQGDSILLDAGSGYNYYSWSTGETSQSIYASQGGNYDATVGDSVAVNNNYSLEFDWASGYVDCGDPNELKVTGPITYMAWVKSIQFSNLAGILGRSQGGSSNPQNIGSSLMISPFGKVIFEISDGSTINQLNSSSTLILDTLYHIAITWDGSNSATSMKIFINGIMDTSSISSISNININIPSTTEDNRFKIGLRDYASSWSGSDSLVGYHKGTIDDASVWNISLDSNQIQQYMNCSPSGNEAGLVGYWDFEEGSGTTTTDQTSNVNDGTLNGGVTWSTDVPNQTCVSCTATDDITITELQPTVGSETVSECNSYLWSTDGQTYNQTGQYTAVLTNSQGCDSIVTLNLTINQPPTIDAGADQTICSGNPVTISGTGATSYTWDNGVSDGVAFSPLSTATYTVTGTDGNGCENSDQVLVTVNTLPAVSGGLDVSVCIGDSAVLNGSGAVSYSWDNGITDGVHFIPLFTNTYTVTGTDGNGCENSDQVDVTVNALPTVGAGVDQTVCEGDPVTVSGTGASSYTWDNGVSDGVAFNATTTTTYTVTGTDVNGCENTDNIVVTVTSSPNVVAVAAADSVCVNWENVTLSGSPAGGVFSGNSVTDNRFYPPVAGVGSHDVVYSYTDPTTGCVGTDTLTIVVEECTGIVEVMNSNLTIYPNPTSDQITIDIKGYNGVVNVEVYDLQGRLLETTTKTTVSLKKHAKGIYVLKVSYGDVTEEVRVVRD